MRVADCNQVEAVSAKTKLPLMIGGKTFECRKNAGNDFENACQCEGGLAALPKIFSTGAGVAFLAKYNLPERPAGQSKGNFVLEIFASEKSKLGKPGNGHLL